MNLLTNTLFLYFCIIIYFIQLYYLIYINNKKNLFIFIVSLLIINLYSNNLIISVLFSFVFLYFLSILKLLNDDEENAENTKYHYIMDIYEPKIENGIIIKDYNINRENIKKSIKEEKTKWLDMNYINEKINKSKLIVE